MSTTVGPSRQVVIENPVINLPYAEPQRHFRFDDDGITDEIVEARRVSSYFIPIARPRVSTKQMTLDPWTGDRIAENTFINRVRERVGYWRRGGYPGITKTTRYLLDYWRHPDRERRLFFCQIEALETAIYVVEASKATGDNWIDNDLRRANEEANPELTRLALKMATGSGKTVVMGMIISWQTLNKQENRQDPRFSDAFLIVTPGITIRDRLRVLYPHDPGNFYQALDLVPSQMLEQLGRASIIITNFHQFKLRELGDASRLTKSILTQGQKDNPFTETPNQMVRRVCRALGGKRNILVLNDEAHHCYRHKPDGEAIKLTGDDKREAEQREEEARIWISGLEAVNRKIGVKRVFDLSATPFFLRGSGFDEGTLFPWVVSDFSLIDAIESGIVKVPRVPVSDNGMNISGPTYRNLWVNIRNKLPRKGRPLADPHGEPLLPAELQGSLHALYENYRQYYKLWEEDEEGRLNGRMPPVFIVVCNNTTVSKLVYDYVSGWVKRLSDGSTSIVPGALEIFNNEEHGGWKPTPNSLLIDSEQLESDEAMTSEFKQMAGRQIEEFKAEYAARFPGRSADELGDEGLLREVLNTVGKPGKLGESIRCVVSVSMLTEGWDANTVTHILGVRAFGTQLLCEQVIGRGLRRMSYAVNDEGMFDPEYAEVYGVPFSFIPCAGSVRLPRKISNPTRVRALEELSEWEITFPKVVGYRYDITSEVLDVRFNERSYRALSTEDVPTEVENAPIIGESSIHTLNDLKRRRVQEVIFRLAEQTLHRYVLDESGDPKPWLFPQLLKVTERWLDECVTYKDDTFPQMLLLHELAADAADRIHRSIAGSTEGRRTLKAILKPYDETGSTRYISFDTTKSVYRTRRKCPASHVALDANWEAKMAQSLEGMSEVASYVKNQGLGFGIPYTLNGEEHEYVPDFIVRIDDGHGKDDLLNLIVEVTGQQRMEKGAKAATALEMWVPAVNNLQRFGRWDYVEVLDPWNAGNQVRQLLHARLGERDQAS